MNVLFRRTGAAAVAAASLLTASCGSEEPEAAAPSGGGARGAPALRIAVVPKGTTHDFWKSVHAGAERAAQGYEGVEVTFTGPEREDDRAQQVALVENLISSRYDAIVIAPLDDQALVAPVRLATQAGIPVVVIDSGLDAEVGKDYISFIATDNELGGRLAGDRMVERLGGQGRVLLLRYQEGSASTALREKGFVDAVAAAPGIELVDPGRYAGATRATAQEAAENLLGTYDQLDGVFCPNESSTFGMLLALRARGLAGNVTFIGFDASDGLVEALGAGEIDALVVQNPIKMGELGVKAAVEHIRGTTPEPRIDTGVMLVTRENMDTPAAEELIAPDFSSLGGP
ncbi:MAG TPA: substrate-binding domain-containing protein [Phycisphaerales bacterium]|nr:substrate-binding domain-containing protein [Phycisphaerales bacterium]